MSTQWMMSAWWSCWKASVWNTWAVSRKLRRILGASLSSKCLCGCSHSRWPTAGPVSWVELAEGSPSSHALQCLTLAYLPIHYTCTSVCSMPGSLLGTDHSDLIPRCHRIAQLQESTHTEVSGEWCLLEFVIQLCPWGAQMLQTDSYRHLDLVW